MPPHDSAQPVHARPVLRRSVLVSLIALAAMPGASRADDEPLEETAVLETSRATQQQRPFGFLTDPSTPSAGVVSMAYGFGLGSGISAERPLPVSLAATNGSHTVSAEYGLTQRVAPFASASFAEAAAYPGQVGSTVSAGVKVQVTRPDAPLRVSLMGAGFHEGLGGASGVSALAAGSLDLARFRVALNLRAGRAFAAGRDLGTQHINLNTAFQRPMTEVFDIGSSGRWSYSAEASTVLKVTALAQAPGGLGVRFAQGADVEPKHDARYWAKATAVSTSPRPTARPLPSSTRCCGTA